MNTAFMEKTGYLQNVLAYIMEIRDLAGAIREQISRTMAEEIMVEAVSGPIFLSRKKFGYCWRPMQSG